VYANGSSTSLQTNDNLMHRFKGTWSLFGVVTEFVLRTYPVENHYQVMNCHVPLQYAEKVAEGFEVIADGAVLAGLKTICLYGVGGVDCFFFGLRPKAHWQTVATDFAYRAGCFNYTTMAINDMLRVWDKDYPKYQQNLWRGVFTNGVRGVGSVFEDALSQGDHPNLGGMIWLAPQVPADSAFAAKKGRFYVFGSDSVPASRDMNAMSAMRLNFEDVWTKLEAQQPFTDCYGNEVTEPLPCVYPQSMWPLLRGWKREMDPNERFVHNHPIPINGDMNLKTMVLEDSLGSLPIRSPAIGNGSWYSLSLMNDLRHTRRTEEGLINLGFLALVLSIVYGIACSLRTRAESPEGFRILSSEDLE